MTLYCFWTKPPSFASDHFSLSKSHLVSLLSSWFVSSSNSRVTWRDSGLRWLVLWVLSFRAQLKHEKSYLVAKPKRIQMSFPPGRRKFGRCRRDSIPSFAASVTTFAHFTLFPHLVCSWDYFPATQWDASPTLCLLFWAFWGFFQPQQFKSGFAFCFHVLLWGA